MTSLKAGVKLYSYWRSSCSYRVRIALNLKSIPYETIAVNLVKDGGEQHSNDFFQLNPMKQVPCLVVKDQSFIESLSILYYLNEAVPEPPLLPDDLIKKTRVRELCEVIVSGIQPLQNLGLLKRLDESKRVDWAQFYIKKGFTAVEKLLSKHSGKYCVGDSITLADCCLVPQVYNAKRFNVEMTEFPRISKIVENLEDHPAFEAAHPSNQPDCPDKQ